MAMDRHASAMALTNSSSPTMMKTTRSTESVRN